MFTSVGQPSPQKNTFKIEVSAWALKSNYYPQFWTFFLIVSHGPASLTNDGSLDAYSSTRLTKFEQAEKKR